MKQTYLIPYRIKKNKNKDASLNLNAFRNLSFFSHSFQKKYFFNGMQDMYFNHPSFKPSRVKGVARVEATFLYDKTSKLDYDLDNVLMVAIKYFNDWYFNLSLGYSKAVISKEIVDDSIKKLNHITLSSLAIESITKLVQDFVNRHTHFVDIDTMKRFLSLKDRKDDVLIKIEVMI